MTMHSITDNIADRKVDLLCSITSDPIFPKPDYLAQGSCHACNGIGSVFTGMPCLQCGGTGNM